MPAKKKRKASTTRKTTGKNYLTKMYDEKIYHQRSKSETVFSVIKRMYGSWLRSRKLQSQKLEIAYKCLAYNLRRQVTNLEHLELGGCP